MRTIDLTATFVFFGLATLAGCSTRHAPSDVAADTIYTGGDIVTVNDAQPSAEAVAVRNGKIVAVGSKADVMALNGTDTKTIDLHGKTLLPGFVDAHGHLKNVGFQALSANLLPPPDGAVAGIADLQQKLREWLQSPVVLMAVRKATEKYGPADRRTVMIHAQTVREDQLDAMKELGIIPSFFGMHTFYWGDWHRQSVLGPERAARISPAASALKRGMLFTEHHDAPVALPSSTAILSAAVNRVTRSGFVLGPEQRISPLEAIKSITINAAYQDFQESSRGSIEVGKIADLVVLSANPLTVDPTRLRDIEVVETIKEGESVFRAP